MSLRTFHLVFVLVVMMAADMFAGWAVHEHQQTGDPLELALGILAAIVGLAVVVYAIWFVGKLDKAKIE